MTQSITLFTGSALALTFTVTSADERVPGRRVLSTFAEGRRIARRTIGDDWEPDDIAELGSVPRQIMYVATDDEPGVNASLYALWPDTGEAWKGEGDENMEAVFLGVVVRARECRVAPDDLLREALDHFISILGGQTIEPIEQLLKRLV